MSHCEVCGGALRTYQKFTCSQECYKQRRRRISTKENRSPYKDLPKCEVIQTGRRRVIETDSEQLEIKRSTAAKWACPPSPVKQYRPGTPEWDELVGTITPLSQIPVYHGGFTGGAYMGGEGGR